MENDVSQRMADDLKEPLLLPHQQLASWVNNPYIQAGINDIDALSSHSLRRGLATSAARAGAPLHAIMRAGRWKQTNTVMEYIEDADRFTDHAAKHVMKQMEK